VSIESIAPSIDGAIARKRRNAIRIRIRIRIRIESNRIANTLAIHVDDVAIKRRRVRACVRATLERFRAIECEAPIAHAR